MCLAQFIDLGRSTKDIDFLLKAVDGNVDVVKNVIDEIASIEIGDDFVFSQTHVSTLSETHKKYPGYRIRVQGQLGQIQQPISIDIGVGDVVRPSVLQIELLQSDKPLFESSVSLQAYPPEYIFSEKYEAIIYLGEINGRMKDFYDCHNLILNDLLDSSKLKRAIQETFKQLETEIGLIDQTCKTAHQKRWEAFKRKEEISIGDISSVIDEINAFVEGHVNF